MGKATATIKNKQTKEKQIKKILLSFWFWLGVWVVFTIIFACMPVKYYEGSLTWDAWEGINLYVTILGYISALGFLMMVILIIIDIINHIHKTSINQYWKISFTIIGIALIVAFTIFYVRLHILENTSFDERTAKEERIKESLVEDGYEVMFVIISNYSKDAPFFEWYNIKDNTICDDSMKTICYSDKIGVSVEMKSLGSPIEQVRDALSTLWAYSEENAFTYRVTIKSPTDTCNYLIFGDKYRLWTDSPTTENYLLVNNEIEKYKFCS